MENVSRVICIMFRYVEMCSSMSAHPPPFEDPVAERIYLLRMAMGENLTQAYMARLVGVSQPTWAFWENSYRKPNWEHLSRIRIATGADHFWVMDGSIKDMPAELLMRIEVARRELARQTRTKPKKTNRN